MTERAFRFWVNWLVAASALFALLGASWIVVGSFDPFGIHDGMLSKAILHGAPLAGETRDVYHFALGLLGATSAGYFVLFGFVARHGLRRRERWAHISLSASLGTWFVLDSVASVMIGATFNVLHVNLPCLLVLGIPLLLLRRSAEAGVTGTDRRNEESTPGDRTRDREGPS